MGNILRILLAGIMLVLLEAPMLFAGPEETQLAAARKEGKVACYTSSPINEAVALARDFEARYPGIKVDVFRASSQGLMSRVMNEHRAQRYALDVVNINIQILTTFKEEGILGRYVSPESRTYPEGVKDPDGYWTGIYYNVGVIAYNRNLVSAKDAPRTYEDLTQPKWHGKIMMNRLVTHWFAQLIQQMGREKAENLCRRLAANGLIYRNGGTLVEQLVSAGEAPVGFPLYGYSTELLKIKGAPVEWHRPDPVFTSLNGMGIGSKSPHPNAAKLFVDFTLSQAGQNRFSEFGKDPARPGAKHPVPRLVEGLTFPRVKFLSSREYAELSKVFREIFKVGN